MYFLKLIRSYRQEIRKELRNRLLEMLKGNTCEKRTKIKAIWAAIWPEGYQWVRMIYSKVTGLDRKYRVE